MPAKRVIILDRNSPGMNTYRAVLWADVPAGNQSAYFNPAARSAYENISPAELQAIQNGQVAEKVVNYSPPSGAVVLGTMQSWLQSEQAAFQAEVTAIAPWADYGRYWDGSAWQAPTGVPMCAINDNDDNLPTFFALGAVSAFGANKFQFVLYNNAALTTAQRLIVRVRKIVIKPGTAAVTGAASGPWTIRRRTSPTTPPSGTGGITPVSTDSQFLLPNTIGCWGTPQTAPSGGTLETFNQFIPQPDEWKVSTLDAPTFAAVKGDLAGQVVYDCMTIHRGKPLTLRPGQTLEIVQDATGGTGNAQMLVVFTVGG